MQQQKGFDHVRYHEKRNPKGSDNSTGCYVLTQHHGISWGRSKKKRWPMHAVHRNDSAARAGRTLLKRGTAKVLGAWVKGYSPSVGWLARNERELDRC